jgi:hypothetical protein
MQDELLKVVIDRLERIDDHLQRVSSHGANVDVTLAKQSVLLEEHIKRTNLLEDRMEAEVERQNETLAPIKKHVDGIQFLGKALGVIGTLLGIALAAVKLTGN